MPSVLLVPFHPCVLGWLAATYALRMFAVTAGYHGYFSHRSYKLGRGAQFVMAVLAALLLLAAGWPAFVWGYVVSTVLVYQATFSTNSVAHLSGSRRLDTPDHSHDNWWLALLTSGEGGHNNHHFLMSVARQGMCWWELDLTYYIHKLLSLIGIARDLRPFRVLAHYRGSAQ